MKLITNKDFIKEYKDDAWRGFSLKECISIAGAFGTAVVCMYFLHKFTDIPVDVCVYLAVPLAAPILGIGFYRYQEMGPLQLLKEMNYSRKTAELAFEAEEVREQKRFKMKTGGKEKRHGHI